ncbi:MAG: hypothetical protein ACRC8S_22990 [Fimbriiglobus sp.]
MGKAGSKKAKVDEIELPPEKPAASRPFLGTILKGFLAFGIILGALALVVRLGNFAGKNVAEQDRYLVPFADIQCEPPQGLDRQIFLTEVRHLSKAPERLSAVDAELPKHLQTHFAAHPWVESVGAVEVKPDRSIHVELKYRTPVLAIVVIGDADLWSVDRLGTVLPHRPPPSPDLTRLLTPQEKPSNIGQLWPDERVRSAANLASTYKPRSVEMTEKGWRLTQRDGSFLMVGYSGYR